MPEAGVAVDDVTADGLVMQDGELRGDCVGPDGLTARFAEQSDPTLRAQVRRLHGLALRDPSPVDVGPGGETWGHGERFGYATLSDGRVYCFATANVDEGSDGGDLAEAP